MLGYPFAEYPGLAALGTAFPCTSFPLSCFFFLSIPKGYRTNLMGPCVAHPGQFLNHTKSSEVCVCVVELTQMSGCPQAWSFEWGNEALEHYLGVFDHAFRVGRRLHELQACEQDPHGEEKEQIAGIELCQA